MSDMWTETSPRNTQQRDGDEENVVFGEQRAALAPLSQTSHLRELSTIRCQGSPEFLCLPKDYTRSLTALLFLF